MSLQLKASRGRVRSAAMPGVGDPGLFGFIGSAISKVASVARNIPGPIGWAGSALSKLTTAQRDVQLAGQGPAWGAGRGEFLAQAGMPQVPAPGIRAFVERTVPGGETGTMPAPTVGAPSGYHVNKTGYWLKDGTYIPPESRWVKNRRRNPLNPRAASKAIGRIESLKRATKRFSHITIKKKCCK